MASVVAVVGQVRSVSPFGPKGGTPLGRSVGVLTEVAGELGDILTVQVWNDPHGKVRAEPGDQVEWAVAVSPNSFEKRDGTTGVSIRASLRGELTPAKV